MPPQRPPDPPDDIGANDLWEAFKERSSWWIPTLSVLGVAYSAIFVCMFVIGALAMWSIPKIFMATNFVVLALVPMVSTIVWLNRHHVHEALAAPEGKPDFTWGQNMEHQSRWQEAVQEYRKVHGQFPLDAESLWRIAMIQRDRLADEDGYLATLQEIVLLPDDAGPAWILVEARDRLLRMADADPEVGARQERETEIELPDDDRPWGRFGPED